MPVPVLPDPCLPSSLLSPESFIRVSASLLPILTRIGVLPSGVTLSGYRATEFQDSLLLRAPLARLHRADGRGGAGRHGPLRRRKGKLRRVRPNQQNTGK